MECKKCGKELRENAKYCDSCGKKQEENKLLFVLKSIFVGKTGLNGLINFIRTALLWCFSISSLLIISHLINRIVNGLLKSFVFETIYFGGAGLIIAFAIRCSIEINRLAEKSCENTEDGKENRLLLINLFSGFMTFFGMMIALLVAMHNMSV